jgi:hypothetical protein
MGLLKTFQTSLAAFTLVLLTSVPPASAAAMRFTLSEADKQPIPLLVAATPGTVLLCDQMVTSVGGGSRPSVPMFLGGAWGCYITVMGATSLVDPSESVTFAARANDLLFPSQATVCSEPDTVPDFGDSPCTLSRTGGFALQEEGTETTGPEETLYEPPGVGFPGYGTIPNGSMPALFAEYNIISDQPRPTPEPPAILLVLAGLIVWLARGRAWSRVQ